jgi:LmbE family N-acetylglucosaminyl deacetylase
MRRTRPQWIFAPYWVDAHPDHVAATRLIEDARFWAKLTKSDLPCDPHHPQRIFNYYCVHLKMHPQPAFVLDITEHWERKRQAIGCYESQFVTGREAMQPSFLEQLEITAAYWGQSIGVRYGEPFTSREPIGLTDLDRLV